MGLRDTIQGRRKWSPGAVAAAGITASIIVIFGAIQLVDAGESDAEAARRAEANARFTDTTIRVPGFEDPPPTFILPDPNDPIITEQDNVPQPPVAQLDEEAHSDLIEDRYAESAIPPDQFEAVFPPGMSGLDATTFAAAKELGAAIVQAQVSGVGRERFPGYFPGDRWPPPTMPNYVADFATASTVEGHPNLVRTVVIYHGTNAAGINFAQIRIAQYLSNDKGKLAPLQADYLPLDVSRRDGLLVGETILG